jgi:hypothetical protein
MKRKLAILFFISSLFTAINISYGQNYATGLGVRLGAASSGITIKHFLSSTGAIEGIVGFGRHHVMFTGLYEAQRPFPTEGLSWYYGGGAHIGFFRFRNGDGYYYYKSHGTHIVYYDDDAHSEVAFGVDFILGMEYKLINAPVAFSLDVKPFVDLTPGVSGYWDGALTIRFTF